MLAWMNASIPSVRTSMQGISITGASPMCSARYSAESITFFVVAT